MNNDKPWRIELSTLCRYAETTQDGKFVNVMSGGISGFRVAKLPAQLTTTFYYVFRTAYRAAGAGRDYDFNLNLKEPDGEILEGFGVAKTHPKTPDAAGQESSMTTIIVMTGLTFRKEGRHVIEVTLDGTIVEEYEIWLGIIPTQSPAGDV